MFVIYESEARRGQGEEKGQVYETALSLNG